MKSTTKKVPTCFLVFGAMLFIVGAELLRFISSYYPWLDYFRGIAASEPRLGLMFFVIIGIAMVVIGLIIVVYYCFCHSMDYCFGAVIFGNKKARKR